MRSGKLAHDSVVNVETRERKEDPISKIKEYKELLDMGIISDEESNIKKKELLGF